MLLPDSDPTPEAPRSPFHGLPRRALILFSGPAGRRDGLAAFFWQLGYTVEEVDIRIGGAAHDLADRRVATAYLARISAGEYCFVFVAPPCSSFSVAHSPRLRSHAEVEGVQPVPSEWRAYLRKHNALADFAAAAASAAEAAGALWMVENPADRADRHSVAYWPRFADCGAIWRMPAFVELEHRARPSKALLAQCALNAPAQQLTTLVADFAHVIVLLLDIIHRIPVIFYFVIGGAAGRNFGRRRRAAHRRRTPFRHQGPRRNERLCLSVEHHDDALDPPAALAIGIILSFPFGFVCCVYDGHVCTIRDVQGFSQPWIKIGKGSANVSEAAKINTRKRSRD